MERAKSIYSLHCQPESDELFAAQIEALLGLMGDDFSTEVITVERESDTAFLVFTLSVIGGTIIRSEPSLTIFENGRWVDNDCAAGRAAFGYLDEPEDEPEPSIAIAFEEGDLPVVREVPFPTLSNDPATHTDEEIASSAEAIINAFWRGMFAVPDPDLEAMAETITIECRDSVMEMITPDLDNLRWAYAYEGETAWSEVTGVQRVDDTSALVEALFSLDDVPLIEMVPALHVFEDGQWRQAEC